MATITPTVAKDCNLQVVTWLLGNADTGVPVQILDWADFSVQVAGTFGAATVILEGSNDGSVYATLTDPQGTAISKTTAAIEQCEEFVRWVRPVSSGGTGTALVVTIVGRRNR